MVNCYETSKNCKIFVWIQPCGRYVAPNYSCFIHYYQICNRNKYATQVPHIYHKCQLVHEQIWEKHLSIYTSSTRTHFTLLAYTPQQICLSHHICMTQYINNAVFMETPYYHTYKSNTTNYNFTDHAISIYVPATNITWSTTYANYIMCR